MGKYARYKRTIYVRCHKCDDWIDEEKVDFIDIEEDFQGRDVLTFKCPICKVTARSLRRG